MEILRQLARLVGHKNRQYETLTEVNVQGYKVRIWRQARTLEQAKRFDHFAYAEHMANVCSQLKPEEWSAMLMKLPDVACVAIVNAQGNGVSAYPDWY